jgi:hypothetical protein
VDGARQDGLSYGSLLNEMSTRAQRSHVDESEQDLAAIDEGIAEAGEGLLLDYDDVKADILKKLSSLHSHAEARSKS